MPEHFHDSIVITDVLKTSDFFTFCLILVITILVSFLKSKKNDGILEYLLMGRKLTLPFFVCTLVATWYGGIFGVTEIAFNQGIYNFVTQGIFWYVAYFIFALFLVDKVKDGDAATLPELVRDMFGPRSAKVAAIFNFFSVMPIAYTISIGLFIQLIFGVSLTVGMLIGILFVLGYTLSNGLKGIVYSDVVQFGVMCSSVFAVVLISIFEFGGVSFLKGTLEKSYFQITGKSTLWETLAWGFIALSTLVDPNFYHRVFATKTKGVAKKGILISTFIWILFDLSTTFGAMYAKAIIPQADSSKAYFFYALQVLPSPLKGFFLAGVAATVLSTLDSYLFLSGMTVSYDLLGKKKEKTSQQVSIFFIGGISIVLALLFDGNIKTVWKTLGSYSAACMLPPLLIAFFWPRLITDKSFVRATLLGALSMTLWRFQENISLDGFYIGFATTLVVLFISLSLEKGSTAV